MNESITHMKDLPAFRCRIPATAEEIFSAESNLNLHFSQEYREYLFSFGIASVYGHELTGICTVPRLNVVNVTLNGKKFNSVPDSWYVIEDANIDGILIWQDQSGEIYQTSPHQPGIKISNSMLDYLSNSI